MLCEHSLPAGQVLSTVVKEKQTKRSRAVLCGENMVEVFLTFAHFGEVILEDKKKMMSGTLQRQNKPLNPKYFHQQLYSLCSLAPFALPALSIGVGPLFRKHPKMIWKMARERLHPPLLFCPFKSMWS